MRKLWLLLAAASVASVGCGDSGTTGTGGGDTGGSSTGGDGQGGSTTTTNGGGGEGGSTTSTMDVCGDGQVTGFEACDDANTASGDGCDPNCAIETGYDCTGEPSACVTVCGDGVLIGLEACDDGNVANEDGCSSMCAVENGYTCDTASPTACMSTCGDGFIAAGAEDCDDGNTDDDDGCSATCAIELGWSCMDEPSTCMTGCGDGIIAGTEACDDGNMADTDGCSATCAIETGYGCSGMPSVCAIAGTCTLPILVTGDGFIWQAPTLDPYGDDLKNTDGTCEQPSSSAAPKPDVVFSVDLVAGDTLHVAESGAADVLMHVLDGACGSATPCAASFDGLQSEEIDPGLVFHAPTTGTYVVVIDTWGSSTPTSDVDLLFEISPCGDGVLGSGEACDDGNMTPGDGCSATCTVDTGYSCTGEPSVCVALPNATCADPIVVTGSSFQYAGDHISGYGDDANYNAGTGCQDVSTTAPSGYDLVFRVDALAGDKIKLRQLGTLDGILHILAQPNCAGGSACAASTDFGETTGITYTAPAAGPVYLVVESYGNPSDTTTFDVRIDIERCGDGVVTASEGCDDGDLDPGDGCSPTCTAETGFMCSGSPSVCTALPAATCAAPIVVSTNPFQMSGTNFAAWGDDANFSGGTGCTAVGSSPSGFDQVFQVNVLAGDIVKVRELGSLDSVLRILAQPTCGAGVACAASSDSAEATGLTYTAPADGPVFVVVESWGNPSAATTWDVRIDVSHCGNGILEGSETCDDGNVNPGDGCSATCGVETGFACNGSTCFDVSACTTATCYLGPCAGTVVTASSTSVPAAIPDGAPTGGAVLTIPVAATGTITNMVMHYDITHTWDSDVDMFLTGPNGDGERDVCTDNGGASANFTNTFLRDSVFRAVTAGTAPFAGVYRPETAFSAFNGQSVTGTWTLRVADDSSGDTGTVNAWDLAFCVTP